MKIRKIALSELEQISKLLVEQYPGQEFSEVKEHTEWHLKGFPEICLAAEEKNEIIGFIISHLHENNLEIEELYAAKGHETTWKTLMDEVLKKIPRVSTVTIWMENFKELIKQLR